MNSNERLESNLSNFTLSYGTSGFRYLDQILIRYGKDIGRSIGLLIVRRMIKRMIKRMIEKNKNHSCLICDSIILPVIEVPRKASTSRRMIVVPIIIVTKFDLGFIVVCVQSCNHIIYHIIYGSYYLTFNNFWKNR